jgi:serine/threonine protein kinase
MSNLIGQSLGRYHILEQLGEGGMATVYKAFDTRLERPVALKVILPTREHTEKFLKRFEREAKGLARLSHPNIVKVLDYGEHEGLPYLVMEYQPGGTLKDKLGKAMGYREAAKLLAPVARALGYAHAQKVVHRDVKPSNILLTGSGEPMLSDFGVAKMLVEDKPVDLTGTGVGIGTPEYMAPEQGMGKEVDGRTDIYSLGIVFYELVTGRKPYRADTPMAVLYKQMTEALPHPQQYVGELPEGVVGVMLKALAKDPKDRYQDGESFAEALEKLGRGEVEGVWGEPIKEAPKTRRLAWAIGGVVGLVVLAVGIGLGSIWMKHGASPVTMATSMQAPTEVNPVVSPSNTQAIPTNTSIAATRTVAAPGTANNCAPQINSPSTQNSQPIAADAMQAILDQSQVLSTDEFSNPLFPGWARYGGGINNLYVKDTMALFVDGAQLHRNYGLQVGEAVRMLTRFTTDASFTISVWSHNYNEPNFRQWGIGGGGWGGDPCGRLQDLFYEGANGSPDQITIYEAMGMVQKPDTWYFVLLWVKGPSQFYVRIWEQDNPNIFVDRQFDMFDSENWINRKWEPNILVDSGTLEVKNYTELVLPLTP